jgi:site-specific recombinase XerC
LLRLSGKEHRELFLNRLGEPYSLDTLSVAVKRHVYSYTGVATHPHAIRSIWATTFIRDTGDFYSAAIMLNDTLETAIKRYAHLMEQGVAEKSDQWLQDLIKKQK